MDKVSGNCTGTKADMTVKAVFDGNQSGQQAFMKLIRRNYRMSCTDVQNNDINKTTYSMPTTARPVLRRMGWKDIVII